MATAGIKVLKALIMGPPGCGKGTISERIVKDFAMIHVASGDNLRRQILQGTGNRREMCYIIHARDRKVKPALSIVTTHMHTAKLSFVCSKKYTV